MWEAGAPCCLDLEANWLVDFSETFSSFRALVLPSLPQGSPWRLLEVETLGPWHSPTQHAPRSRMTELLFNCSFLLKRQFVQSLVRYQVPPIRTITLSPFPSYRGSRENPKDDKVLVSLLHR